MRGSSGAVLGTLTGDTASLSCTLKYSWWLSADSGFIERIWAEVEKILQETLNLLRPSSSAGAEGRALGRLVRRGWRQGASRVVILAPRKVPEFKVILDHSHCVETGLLSPFFTLGSQPAPLTPTIQGTLGCWIGGAFLPSFSVVCPHLGTAAVSPRGVRASGNRWENWNREIGRGLRECVQ